MKATFPKRERLRLRRHIDGLFEDGRAFVAYPLRVVYCLSEEEQDARSQVMVSVSKRYHRRATARNRIKRLIREAYRLNKATWIAQLEHHGLYAHIAFVSVAREMPTFEDVERAMLKTLNRIARESGLLPPPSSDSCPEKHS